MGVLQNLARAYQRKFSAYGQDAYYRDVRDGDVREVRVRVAERGSGPDGRYAVVTMPRSEDFSPALGGFVETDSALWEILDWHETTNAWQMALLCITDRRPAA